DTSIIGISTSDYFTLASENSQNGIQFRTNGNYFSDYLNNATVAMTIDNDGEVGIGTASPSSELEIYGNSSGLLRLTTGNASGYAGLRLYEGSTMNWALYTTTSDDRLYVHDSNFGQGVYMNQNDTSWNSYSDARLKNNVENYTVLDKLESFRAVSFNWKNSGKRDLGVIAQELYTVFPDIVDKGDDEDRELSKDDPGSWGVRYSMLAPLALQGLKEMNSAVNVTDYQDKKNPAILVNNSGHVGIGSATPTAKLDVVGDIHYTGTITDVSDRRLKENIEPLENGLEVIRQIPTYSFTMKEDEDQTLEYGVMAQDVQEVAPALVRMIDPKYGYLGVNYIGLIPLSLDAIQTLDRKLESVEQDTSDIKKQNAEIKKENEEIKERLSKLEEQNQLL
ncbi:MAG: tail fiber domain-containing protein, partial [Bdellovibrionales bacterium]|nr:tail fiber domain-containing protein [Bdellovibrionales bacterium]